MNDLIIRFFFIFTIILFSNSSYAKTSCGSLSEKSCMASENCYALKGASNCNHDASGFKICTDDLIFKECKKRGAHQLAVFNKMKEKNNKEKILCGKTRGKWIKSELNEFGFCRCQKANYYLNHIGCTSIAQECKKAGGIFYSKGAFRCNAEMRLKLPKYCRKAYIAKYNYQDLCLCQDQTLGVISRRSRKCSDSN